MSFDLHKKVLKNTHTKINFYEQKKTRSRKFKICLSSVHQSYKLNLMCSFSFYKATQQSFILIFITIVEKIMLGQIQIGQND